jgi:predicted transcriptional regulator
MTTTTTIRLDDDLKTRVAAAAQQAGQTAHAFILDAIARTVEEAELDQEFHRVADERWARILATGKTVPWDDAKAWLEARSRGEKPRVPKARKPAP